MFGTNAVYAFKYILKRDNNPQYQQMGIPASGLSNILYNANLPLEQAEKKKMMSSTSSCTGHRKMAGYKGVKDHRKISITLCSMQKYNMRKINSIN